MNLWVGKTQVWKKNTNLLGDRHVEVPQSPKRTVFGPPPCWHRPLGGCLPGCPALRAPTPGNQVRKTPGQAQPGPHGDLSPTCVLADLPGSISPEGGVGMALFCIVYSVWAFGPRPMGTNLNRGSLASPGHSVDGAVGPIPGSHVVDPQPVQPHHSQPPRRVWGVRGEDHRRRLHGVPVCFPDPSRPCVHLCRVSLCARVVWVSAH